MSKYSIEYLIKNEDVIDWEALSGDKDDSLNLVEIRLFRKRINWSKYLNCHRIMSTDELEMASKYFTKNHYDQLAAFEIATDEFIIKHAENFDFRILLKSAKLSDDNIMNLRQYWENIPGIEGIIKNSKYIDLESSEYSQLAVMLESEK